MRVFDLVRVANRVGPSTVPSLFALPSRQCKLCIISKIFLIHIKLDTTISDVLKKHNQVFKRPGIAGYGIGKASDGRYDH